jgi:hypothetical protein
MLSAQVSHARLEELLLNWARWCHGRINLWGGVVLHLDYQAAGEEAQDARRQPKPKPPMDWDGLMIERMVIKLPQTQRKVLRTEYVTVNRRRGETSDQLRERKRRKLRMAAWQYEDHLCQAKRMVINLLRRHMPGYSG